jgi:hypothetical protein
MHWSPYLNTVLNNNLNWSTQEKLMSYTIHDVILFSKHVLLALKKNNTRFHFLLWYQLLDIIKLRTNSSKFHNNVS